MPKEERMKVGAVHQVELENASDDNVDTYTLFRVSSPRKSSILVSVQIEGEDVTMEVDTGAAVSVISEATYEKVFKNVKLQLQPTPISLRTYTGEDIEVWPSYL
jgi:predicted aspartyl protease